MVVSALGCALALARADARAQLSGCTSPGRVFHGLAPASSEPGDVATGAGEACYQTGADAVGSAGKNDWDRAGRLLERDDRRSAKGDNGAGGAPNAFGGVARMRPQEPIPKAALVV